MSNEFKKQFSQKLLEKSFLICKKDPQIELPKIFLNGIDACITNKLYKNIQRNYF